MDVQALLGAVRQGNRAAVLHLLAQGIPVDGRDAQDTSALMVALVTGDRPLVKELLRAGADVNQTRQPHGITPLMLAIAHRQADITQLLLQQGANIEQVNVDILPLLKQEDS
jgi:ankyrin repeat protein